MNERPSTPGLPTLLACIAALAAVLAWAAAPSSPASAPLAAMLPQGALMTVESAHFGDLVAAWNRSPEQRAWLTSANYSAFANSRLFTRLGDAQSSFTDAAKTGIDGDFLKQIAGGESIFAWYNIGNLEFLYISHLSPDRLSKLNLLAQRGSFARRESAGTAFYVRSSSGAAASPEDNAPVDQPRTVAFAVRGDWLLLATREDLIAGALQLMAAPPGPKQPVESQATAGWYAAAAAASPAPHGDLHMLLDLQSLNATPQFRTYWIQRNVTATRAYRAAVVDLYREPGQFREERVLLPMQPATAESAQPDLGAMEQLVPERAGVYRVLAHPDAAAVLAALKEKVLVRLPSTAGDSTSSPPSTTTVTPAGGAADFDTRIDAPAPPTRDPDLQFTAVQQAINNAAVESMLTVDRTDTPAVSQPFVHIRSAVALRSASPWDEQALATSLLAALRPRLSTSSLGIGWTTVSSGSSSYRTLSAAVPLCLSIHGSLAILTTDPAMMEDILQRRSTPPVTAAPGRLLAGFRHDAERGNFRRLMADLNQTGPASQGSTEPAQTTTDTPTAVDLFRDNLPSLSDTFAALASEHFAEASDGHTVHQTVLYRWQPPSASR